MVRCIPVFMLSLFCGATLFALPGYADNTGAELYAQHCAKCHGEQGEGKKQLAGKEAPKLTQKLISYRDKTSGKEKKERIHEPFLKNMNDAQIKSIAEHIAQLPRP